MKFEEFKEGDKILFNERKTPLKVKQVEEDRLLVDGPSGGEYEVYYDVDTCLVAKPGERKYSSYCKDLRKVGEWIREGDEWVHSKTDAFIKIVEKDNGFWGLKSEKFDEDLDNPMYGFSSKAAAVEEVENFVSKNPEG